LGRKNDLLPEHHSPTREIFYCYLVEYLEVYGWENQNLGFEDELITYTIAKTKAAKQPICSLSSGQFASEDQMDSVVLFKPQQYSNKNQLGGRQIKRGISKIWSLEMLLRQALWSASAGKFEEQQPVFLYIFPAYVYSPQTAAAIRLLVNDMKRVSIRKVCKQWLEAGMHYSGLRSLDWRKADEVEEGRYPNRYTSADLPFMATIPKVQETKR
jgi:CRISPR-associated protein Csc3